MSSWVGFIPELRGKVHLSRYDLGRVGFPSRRSDRFRRDSPLSEGKDPPAPVTIRNLAALGDSSPSPQVLSSTRRTLVPDFPVQEKGIRTWKAGGEKGRKRGGKALHSLGSMKWVTGLLSRLLPCAAFANTKGTVIFGEMLYAVPLLSKLAGNPESTP